MEHFKNNNVGIYEDGYIVKYFPYNMKTSVQILIIHLKC